MRTRLGITSKASVERLFANKESSIISNNCEGLDLEIKFMLEAHY